MTGIQRRAMDFLSGLDGSLFIYHGRSRIAGDLIDICIWTLAWILLLLDFRGHWDESLQ